MFKTTRRKIVFAVLVLLALAIFLPPNINGARFSKKLAATLSAALGREVRIGSVKYRLFPRPGFDLYDFQVMDDPAFSAEPLLMCGKVTADLRLTSLWQGRLEIANLKLTDDAAPPSLNLVYSGDRWNLESLLLRAEQVPTAPTSRRRAEQRSRFPYIAATAGRINLKIGPEKKPYAITNTDFAFWLAAENVWHLRMEGKPVRTDMNLNDTGTVRFEGDVTRSTSLRTMPVKLQFSWEKAQLGQFTSLVLGQDKGWRGALDGSAEIAGPLENLHITAAADLRNFRRFDINRDDTPLLRTRCRGDYSKAVLSMKCDTPLGNGGLLITSQLSPVTQNYDVSVQATHVPLSIIAAFARDSRKSLPEDFTATGELNAGFGFHSKAGVHDFHGTGNTTPFLIETAAAEKPFPVSAIHFHMGPPDTPGLVVAKKKKSGAAAALPPSKPGVGLPGLSAAFQPSALTFDSFSVQMGPSTTLELQGNADSAGYYLSAKGMVPMERLLAFGRATGFPSRVSNATASAQVDLNINGVWANFAPGRLHGTVHLQNVAAWIPGIKDRLLLSEAEADLTDAQFTLNHMTGQFEHSPVAFTGSVTAPAACDNDAGCPLQFDLHLDTLTVSDAAELVGAGEKSWNLPFISGSDNKLPEFRASGNIAIGELKLSDVPLEKFAAHVDLGDHGLAINHIAARLGGGSTQGEWKLDWSGSQPRFSGTGAADGVALDRVGPPDTVAGQIAQWVSGRGQVSYSVHFEGKSQNEMLSSAAGRIEFQVANGVSRALLLDAGRPLKFQAAQGALDLDRQSLKVLPSKFKAENRIYMVSGNISLANKQAKLKVSTTGTEWDVNGALERPQITPQTQTAQAAPARTK
jgi:AsmA-like protein